jgi:hypothetical protein
MLKTPVNALIIIIVFLIPTAGHSVKNNTTGGFLDFNIYPWISGKALFSGFY